jgi:hypothetical protein
MVEYHCQEQERETLIYRCPDCRRILQYQGGGYFRCIYCKDYFDFDVVIKKMECQHLRVTVHWKLYARETRFEPAEYIGKAQCQDCGEWMEPEDVPDEAERKEETIY